jgi:hypothetical protein
VVKIGGKAGNTGPVIKPPVQQTKPPSNTQQPPRVGDVRIAGAKASAYNKVKVSWAGVSGASGYVVYYKTSTAKTWRQKKVAGEKVVSTVVSGLTTGKSHWFRVKAYKTAGSVTVYSGKFSSIKKVTPKLAKTKGLKSAKRSAASLKLSWKKTAGAKRYEVWRKAGSGKWKKVATTAKRSLTQKKLKRGVTYRYRVRAYVTVSGKKSYGPYSATVKRRMG